jgi:hypothetical protein
VSASASASVSVSVSVSMSVSVSVCVCVCVVTGCVCVCACVCVCKTGWGTLDGVVGVYSVYSGLYCLAHYFGKYVDRPISSWIHSVLIAATN